MLIYEILQKPFTNWSFPNEATMLADFKEYKKKESSKWQGRAKRMGFKFPIFDTFEDFKNALTSADVITLTREHDSHINNRSNTSSIADLKSLVSGYIMPRDVDRIIQGFETNAAIPMPIILKGKNGEWVMAGNTRCDTAFILGVNPVKVLLVDVSE